MRTFRQAARAAAAVVVLGTAVVVSPGGAAPAAAHADHDRSPVLAAPSTSPARIVATLAGSRAQSSADADVDDPPPTPRADCGPGSHPETGMQGRVPREEVESGRASEGYTCNTEMLSSFGRTGGYKVERYVDEAGQECAYYDTTLFFPGNVGNMSSGQLTGVAVLDMTDPNDPVQTATLSTPAMQSPHESMSLNQERGLLAAASANPVFYPAVVDIYDVSEDCLNPELKASAPTGGLGHESGWAPDGKTFYVAALHAPTVTAIDVSNPSAPVPLGVYPFLSHGITVSDDGNRLYMTTYSNASNGNAPRGVAIYDVSEIQSRQLNPQMKEVGRIGWKHISTPQIAIPVTIDDRPYLVEMDEFAAGGTRVGAARIIDVADETNPRVVSNIRLEVNSVAARRGEPSNDPGASSSLQGYAGHYCNVPSRVDPGIVACTFILSGLRVFDIRDPLNPREIAYFNGPIPKTNSRGDAGSSYAMSSPTFVPERGEIWYSDGNTGFYAVKLTNDVWPFPQKTDRRPSLPEVAADRADQARDSVLPATGGLPPVLAGAVLLGLALGLRRLRRSAPSG